MKHLLIVLLALATVTASAQIGVNAIAEQRARDLANQSKNQTLQPPSGTPAPAARPPITSTPLTPGQQAYSTFQSQLFAVRTNASPEVKAALARDLQSVAQGTKKPSQPAVSHLVDHLVAALSEAKLSAADKTRVAQEVAVLVNTAAAPAQKAAMVKSVQAILQAGGSAPQDAMQVGSDLQAIVDELR